MQFPHSADRSAPHISDWVVRRQSPLPSFFALEKGPFGVSGWRWRSAFGPLWRLLNYDLIEDLLFLLPFEIACYEYPFVFFDFRFQLPFPRFLVWRRSRLLVHLVCWYRYAFVILKLLIQQCSVFRI